MDADFFVRLAQRGVEQGRVDGIDASAGKRNLSAMARDVIGAADVDDVKFAVALEDRYQHGGGVRFVRERLARRGSDGGKLAPDGLDLEVERRVISSSLQIIARDASVASSSAGFQCGPRVG